MQFLLGEKKEIRINIASIKDDPFTIRNATFELTKNGVVIEYGSATVEGTEISMLIQPEENGYFKMIFTYDIANEILKASVPIEVR